MRIADRPWSTAVSITSRQGSQVLRHLRDPVVTLAGFESASPSENPVGEMAGFESDSSSPEPVVTLAGFGRRWLPTVSR